MNTIEELNQRIADLVTENERIKKTSKQRFDKNKKLEENKIYVEGELSKIKAINEFLEGNGFPVMYHQGLPMVNYSVCNAIRTLQQKGLKIDKPEVDGFYAVKVDGERKIVEIRHRLCWSVRGESSHHSGWTGIHFFNMSDFVLLEGIEL